MHIDALRRDRQLKPHHLPDPAGINCFEIAGLDTTYERPFGAGPRAPEEPVHWIRFRRARLPLKLTNSRLATLGALLGPDTDAWVGRKVGLISTTMTFGTESRLEIAIHIATTDHLEPQAMVEPGQRQALPPAQAPRPASAPALPPPAGIFDFSATAAIPAARVERFLATAAAHGGSWDLFLAWVKSRHPEGLAMVFGQPLDDIPIGAARAMGLYLTEIARPGNTAGPRAPGNAAGDVIDRETGEVIATAGVPPATTGPAAPPSPRSPTASPTAPAVPGATYGRDTPPSDDIPF